MARKNLYFLLVFGALFIFCLPVKAADTLLPEKNPLCWSKEDCTNERKKILSDNVAAQGWVQEKECIGDWGKCLAGSVTKTQVTFGGQNKFSDAGIFIKTIYNYSISIIGIIATVVIIISGLQWASSAGNSETINTAKKRIGGALIGSFIAFMSFVILNAINPATANFRLPQVWMSRPIPLPFKWCQEYKEIEDSVYLSIDDKYLDAVASQVKSYDIRQYKGTKMKKSETRCGLQYALPNGADTCLGNICQGVSVVSPVDVTQQSICGVSVPCACYTVSTNVPFCVPSFIGGQVKLASIDHYVDDVTMWAVCSYTNIPGVIERLGRVAADDVGKVMESNYGISFFEADVESYGNRICGIGYNLEGFILTAEVNDNDDLLLGTIDDTWLIGKNSCGNGNRPFAGFNFSGETSLLWDDPKNLQIVADLANENQMWLAEEMTAGVTCDLDISMGSYPNLSDDLYKP